MEHFRNEDNNIDFMVSTLHYQQPWVSLLTVSVPAVTRSSAMCMILGLKLP